MIEEIKNEKYYFNTSTPNKKIILPCKVNKLLIKNHDFSNIKEFMRKRIDLSELNISNNDYKYIVFDLKPKQLFYVPYIIPEESVSLESNSKDHQLILIVPIEEVKRKITHEEIKEYQDIIPLLSKIALLHKELLSDKGNYLINIANKIADLQNKDVAYYECYSGIKLKYKPNLSNFENNNNLPEFRLSKRKRKKCEEQRKDGFIVTTETSSLEMARIISFESLVQME